jgi:integrase
MSIRKNPNRKKNPWECRWSEDGKHPSRSFHTRKEAEQFDAQRKTALGNGSGFRTKDEKITVDDYAVKFLSQTKKPSTSLRNRAIYEQHIQPLWGHIPIQAIRHSDVQALADSWIAKGLSTRTVLRHLAVLSGIFVPAELDGVIPRLPTKRIRLPEAEEPHRYAMSVEEVQNLRLAVHPNYEAFVFTLTETGMRIGEAINLNIEDFDWKSGTLNIAGAKTKAGIRTVRISVTTQSLISTHIQKTGRTMANQTEPLFVSHKTDTETGLVVGARINYSNFRSRIFKPAAIEIGLPHLQPHDLRRTVASLLVDADTPQKVVQEQLGHADIRTTLNLYAQASEEAHEASVLRMEEILKPAPNEKEKEA